MIWGDDDAPMTPRQSVIQHVLLAAVLGWVVYAGMHAFDHPSTWPAPAPAEMVEALTDR